MRAQDAGRTWESVSQHGSADFHAISVVGVLVVAALFGQGTSSRDAGERFESRVAPMALVDVASSRAHAPLGGDLRAGQLRLRRGRQALARTRPDAERPARLGVGARALRIGPGGPVKISADAGAAGRTAELPAA